jgi:hypothetical protein
MSYNIIVSHRRTFGIHNARRAFSAEEMSYRRECTSVMLKDEVREGPKDQGSLPPKKYITVSHRIIKS